MISLFDLFVLFFFAAIIIASVIYASLQFRFSQFPVNGNKRVIMAIIPSVVVHIDILILLLGLAILKQEKNWGNYLMFMLLISIGGLLFSIPSTVATYFSIGFINRLKDIQGSEYQSPSSADDNNFESPTIDGNKN